MSNLPNDDQRLVDFLRQNRPEIPPSPPDLEEKLFCAIASSPPPQLHHHSPNHPSRFRQLWLVPPAIAASLALAWGGNYLRQNNSLNNSFATINSLSPTAAPQLNQTISKSSKFLISNSNYLPGRNRGQNHQELVKIESFLENNWNDVVTNNPPEMSVESIQNEYLNLAKSKAYYSTKTTNLVTTRR
ncbi:hypothetical protein [Floridanema aerugineum]|uniref:Uncharacterized protein n=1 Tax=Floridaenema aerugineum BLCC-F46 TaxID=3153654 RepID=A0ABV4X670_9CYAN